MKKRTLRNTFLFLAALFAAAHPAQATTNTVSGVVTTLTGGITTAFDSSFAIGISILSILMVIGFIIKGVKVKRG